MRSDLATFARAARICSPFRPCAGGSSFGNYGRSVGFSLQTCFHRHGAGWGAFDVVRFGSCQTFIPPVQDRWGTFGCGYPALRLIRST